MAFVSNGGILEDILRMEHAESFESLSDLTAALHKP